MKTIIYIWSQQGSTPVTGRGGSFCDVLANFEVECDSIEDAKKTLRESFSQVRDAYSCSFDIPSHPNQNLRHQHFCGRVR